MNTEHLGYVVAVVNQASGRAESLADDTIDVTQEVAEATAEHYRRETAQAGRGERYIVCEVIPAEDAS
jgi:hypothetical protein